jgi:hypothetical protein
MQSFTELLTFVGFAVNEAKSAFTIAMVGAKGLY